MSLPALFICSFAPSLGRVSSRERISEIRDASVLRKVLAQVQSAERGLRRLEARVGQSWAWNSGSDSPLVATPFARPGGQSRESQESCTRS
jgi:pyruvoyl-dependent arginine decarboxylase (PvlArgDC)